MGKEDYLMKLNMFQQEAQKIEDQVNMMNQQIIELRGLQDNLSSLENETEKEFLAPIGRGIYVKSEMKEKQLFVNIGSGIVLRKSHQETREIIERQVSQLDEVKERLLGQLNDISRMVTEVIQEAQAESEEKHEKCEDCECEEGEECGKEDCHCGHKH